MLGDLFLSIDDVEPPQHRERIVALLQRGYDVVASVHTVTGRLTQADKCAVTTLSDAALASASTEAKRALALRSGSVAVTVAEPPGGGGGSAAAKGPSASTTAPPPPPCHLRQLRRLHFVAADAVQASQLSSSEDVVRSYDLVSITPKNERVLHQACTSLDVDLICLELWQRMTIKLRAPAIKAALRRGIYFEICYAPGLREPTARRNLFCNAQALVRITRGKHILLSSSARSAFEVRSPLEVVHMATLFGLTHKQTQEAVSLAPRAVLARAEARRAGKGPSGMRVGTTASGAVVAAAAAAPSGAVEEDVEMVDASGRQEPQQQQKQPQQQLAADRAQQQLRPPSASGEAGRGGRKRSAAAVR